jgi:hypothetical protein
VFFSFLLLSGLNDLTPALSQGEGTRPSELRYYF